MVYTHITHVKKRGKTEKRRDSESIVCACVTQQIVGGERRQNAEKEEKRNGDGEVKQASKKCVFRE